MLDPLFQLPRESIHRVMALLYQDVVAALGDSKGVHLETAIAGAGAMGGLYLLRSASLPIDQLPEGQVVLSDVVNESGPELVAFAVRAASMMGLDCKAGWGIPIPPQHTPRKTVAELTKLLEPPFHSSLHSQDMDDSLHSRLAIITGVDLIQQGERILSPEVGMAILVQAMVAGAKTVPAPFTIDG